MKRRFTCTSCNWKFERLQQPKICPNCGKDTIEPDKPVLADDLLQEV